MIADKKKLLWVVSMICIGTAVENFWQNISKCQQFSRVLYRGPPSFLQIFNNLAMVPHSCLEKADGRTRKKHNLKIRHIGYNVDPYGQSFFPKYISAWNGLAQEIAEANTLDLFKSKLAH